MKNGDERFAWWWQTGTSEPETYRGPCDTREEAITEAQAEEGNNLGFVIVEADRATQDSGCFDASRVLEGYEEHNIECWGEDGADIEATTAQERDLETMLAETLETWFKKHGNAPRSFCFGTMRNQETFAAAKQMTAG